MIGAFLGDIIGSPYEFDKGNKTKDFPLFIEKSHFTDDTIMGVAVADALLNIKPDMTDDEIKEELVRSLHRWGWKYPNVGYGGLFRNWLQGGSSEPYGSYGNGAAMRVSSAGWLFDNMETTRRVARLTAAVTHNHPEGIKGAEAVASVIFLARNGCGKGEIKKYVEREFQYDLSRTCDEIRPSYHHVESCQETVPEAITAFLEGSDFEDVIRTAVSLGGDCDTLTSIAGSMAEAFYGVPDNLIEECKDRLPDDVLAVLARFEVIRGRKPIEWKSNSANDVPEEEDKEKPRVRSKIVTGAITLLILVFLGVAIYAFINLRKESKDYQEEAEAREGMMAYQPNAESAANGLYNDEKEALEYTTENPAETDESGLYEKIEEDVSRDNPTVIQLTEDYTDAVGWISVPGTNVEYPFAQHKTDNYYYLHKGLNKQYLYAGTIYIDVSSNRDLTSFNTIFYGHNMRNSTMFGDLDKFQTKTFFEENDAVIIYLPHETIRAKIVACVVSTTDNVPYLYTSEETENFVKRLKKDSLYFRDSQMENPSYITLSTCGYSFENARIIIVAAYEKENAE